MFQILILVPRFFMAVVAVVQKELQQELLVLVARALAGTVAKLEEAVAPLQTLVVAVAVAVAKL